MRAPHLVWAALIPGLLRPAIAQSETEGAQAETEGIQAETEGAQAETEGIQAETEGKVVSISPTKAESQDRDLAALRTGTVAAASAGSAPEVAVDPLAPSEPRVRPTFGVFFDVGVPDGAAVDVAYAPWY